MCSKKGTNDRSIGAINLFGRCTGMISFQDQEKAQNIRSQATDLASTSQKREDCAHPQPSTFAPNAHGQGREGRFTRAERASKALGLEPQVIPDQLLELAQAAESSAQPANKAASSILPQYASGRKSALPGFALVFLQKQAIFLDEWAVRLMDLDPKLAQTWVDVKQLLRTLGPEIKSKAFFYTKQLRDSQVCMHNVRKLKLPCPYGLNAYNCYKLHSTVKPLLAQESASLPPDAPESTVPATSLSISGQSYSDMLDRAMSKANYKLHESPCPKGGYCCRIEQQHHMMPPLVIPSAMKQGSAEEQTALQAALQATASEDATTGATVGATVGAMEGALSAAPAVSAMTTAATCGTARDCANAERLVQEHRIDPHGDRASFFVILRHGAYAGTKLYVKFSGLFELGKLSHIVVTFTRVASNLFELVPHMVTDSASFDWIIPTDKCVYGRNYFTMLGYSFKDSELPEKRQEWEQMFIHPDDLATIHKSSEVLDSPAHGDNYELLYRSKCHNNSYIWTKYIGKVLGRDAQGRATRVLGINIDINRVLEGYEQLQSRVFTDILTGLKNRIYLITHLDEFIAAAHRPLTIIFADITALKVYNDYLGHAIGDKLLCAAALLFQDNIDRNRELIRISGDEIVCLLPNCDETEASTIVHKLIGALIAYNSDAPVRMPVFFSFGTKTVDLSAYAGRKLKPEEKEEAQELFYQAMQEADTQMRQNKRLAHQEHYTLVQAYIEHQLKHPISLHDRRLF